jgi:hypothetical protein
MPSRLDEVSEGGAGAVAVEPRRCRQHAPDMLYLMAMPMPSLRRLTLADTTDETVRRLIDHGEDLFVERKQELPSGSRFGATVASFANTLGGWILLGVADDQSLVGYPKDAVLDLQSHIGHILRDQVDPVPPFATAVREIDRVRISVVRVFESDDTPVVVRESGAIYVRDAGGKQPLRDHSSLVELARRGERARERATARLTGERLIVEALVPPDATGFLKWMAARPAHTIRVVVRIAPVTVTPRFADWPMSRRAAEECGAAAISLVVGPGPPQKLTTRPVEPHGRGVVANAELAQSMLQRETATVVASSGGVVGAAVSRAQRGGNLVLLDALVRDEIQPILSRLSVMLGFAEAYGRALCDLWLLLPGEADVHRAPRRESLMHVSGEIVVPADEAEVTALAERWLRELERNVGMPSFEP